MPGTPSFLLPTDAPDALLQTLLDVSLTAINLLRPIYGPQGEGLVDFSLEYLNLAGQGMLNLPARPEGTMRSRFPATLINGAFAFYKSVFETGEAGRYEVNYQQDGLDNYFRMAARRSGELLVVSFTDTADHDRTLVEQALRASQSREQAARADAERERNVLHSVLTQAPVAIALFQGAEQVLAIANDRASAMWGYPAAQLVNRPLLEAVPELRGQGFAELIAEVARTKEPFIGKEVAAVLRQTDGRLQTNYFNFVYQPLYNADGTLLGVLDIATDVTEQVLARQQVQRLNDELHALNGELLTNSEELLRTQAQMEQFQRALEARVQERTAEARTARTEAERQRQRLESLFMQAPAAICILGGPELVYELVNPGYHALFPGRQLVGRRIADVFPEITDHGVLDTFRRVYETGATNQEQAILIPFRRPTDGQLEDRYFNYVQQARYDEHGHIDGVLVFAFEVTEQVRARQQAEQLSEDLEIRVAGRTSQLQQAQAEADLQRQQLHDIFMQAPAMICIFDGPGHVFQLVNPSYQTLVGDRPLLGMPIAEAMPELAGQPIFGLLDHAYQTGETFYATEMLVQLDHANDHPEELEKRYYNFIYQARHNLAGAVDGILVFAYEVTPQVLARQLVEEKERQLRVLFHQSDDLNEELAAANEELEAANEEIRANNEELQRTQQQLRQLNDDLEARVQERTRQLRDALDETEQQREQLADQQGLLRQILGQVPAAIATLAGPEHRYSFFNDGYQTLSGHRTRLGLTVAEVFPEVVEQGFVNLLDQVYATGRPFVGVEMSAQLYDATTGRPAQHYVDFIYQPLLDGRGEPQGILAFILDVTEKVQVRAQAAALQAQVLAAAQRQAQERETFYQVFEQTPALVALLTGPQHQLTYYNEAYQQLFAGRDMRGRTIAEIQPEAVTHGFVALLDQVFQTGETYFGTELPLFITPPDGGPARETFFNFTYQAYREDDQVTGISVFAYDVTEQVRTRQTQEAQQAQLAVLFEQAPVAVAIFEGPEYVITVANPSVAALWGRTPAQLVGQPLLEALPEVRDQGFKELLDHVVESGEAFVAQEVTTLLERHGRLENVHLNFVYQPLRAADGRITSVAAVATEVTEQVAARQQVAQTNLRLQAGNAELDALNQQLIRTNVDLDNFIYTASHDLKAPISNIEGLLMALQRELPATCQVGEVPYMLELMRGSVERFKTTIAHLSDVVKLQKEHDPEPTEMSLAAVVDDVLLDLQPLRAQTGAELVIDVAECPNVSFSAKNLRSVIYNLLSNALKYRHPDRVPEVHLRCHPEGEYAVLAVQDNGLGLEPGQLPELFGMFRRLHGHVEGSGLGLYMVKRIVENAGGRVTVQSEPGVGSTFTVYFRR